jgi:hypothetical protein
VSYIEQKLGALGGIGVRPVLHAACVKYPGNLSTVVLDRSAV